MLRRFFTSSIWLAGIFVGCTASSDDRRLGDTCDSDDQCATGMSCRQNFVGNACTRRTCTTTCKTDADCQAIDPKGKCFKGCADEMMCMPTP